MADITLMGASFSDVPAVDLPKTGGGTARFTDVSDTTAVASDVAQGKVFHLADGTQATGTSSGGGGSTSLVLGAIRPDAELVQRWAEDKLVVADNVATIPAYTTSAKALTNATSLTPTATVDMYAYSYYFVQRALVIPIYASGTGNGKARCECGLASGVYELFSVPAGTFVASSGRATGSASAAAILASLRTIIFYWPSDTGVNIASQSYGVYTTMQAPTISNSTITLKRPQVLMRGSPTYLSQDYWEAIEDIRYQYVIEQYRVPRDSLNYDGWAHVMQTEHIADCYANGGTLT